MLQGNFLSHREVILNLGVWDPQRGFKLILKGHKTIAEETEKYTDSKIMYFLSMVYTTVPVNGMFQT